MIREVSKTRLLFCFASLCLRNNLQLGIAMRKKIKITNHYKICFDALTAFRFHFSAFIEASAAGTFLDKQQINVQVCSAALMVLPPGVLENTIYVVTGALTNFLRGGGGRVFFKVENPFPDGNHMLEVLLCLVSKQR